MPDGLIPKRPTIPGAEWELSARLMRGDDVVVESTVPLYISDAWFCGSTQQGDRAGRFTEAGRNVARWMDDLAVARARQEAAMKKATKRK